MNFRKKPVTIQAIQYDGTNGMEIAALWSTEDRPIQATSRLLLIQTLEGAMVANPSDWVIRGVKGECYPCKDDIFRATYDAVEVEPETVEPEAAVEPPPQEITIVVRGVTIVLRGLP